MTSPTCAVLLIGNELLSGRTPDANLTFIARKMNELGIKLCEARVVRDEIDEVVAAVNELRSRYTYVFTTGGIGPTHDDITVACIAKAFDVPVERDAATEQKFKDHYGERATAATFKMADFPKGAVLIPNAVSVAPGFRVENVFVLAGIPKVMQSMLEAIVPQLKQGQPIHSKSIDVFARESEVSRGLEDIQQAFPMLEIGSYPFRLDDKFGTSLVIRGTDADAVEQACAAVDHLVDEMGAIRREN